MIRGAIQPGIPLNALGGEGGVSTLVGYHECTGGYNDACARISRVHLGCSVHSRDTMSTPGAYNDGWLAIMSTLGNSQYTRVLIQIQLLLLFLLLKRLTEIGILAV